MAEPAAGLGSQLVLPCGQILPNRLMKAALSEGLATDGNAPDTRLEQLYTRWGAGGFGLAITGNVMVDRKYLGEPGNVVVEDDRDIDSLTRWAKTVNGAGTPIWMQINHPGRQGNPLSTDGRTVAPSAVGLAIPGAPVPRALSDREIRDIVDRFATTAAVAASAGFDGVQVHGAHGYLISQFLSPLSNLRTDRWGGDIEGRSRFLLTVIRAVRAAVPPGFAVGIKLNSADFQRGGFSELESRVVIEMLAEESLDLIEISGGSYESPAMMGRRDSRSSSTEAREAYFLDYATTVRSAAPSIPIAVTGGFRSRSAMSAAVESGDCDVVGIGRPTALAPQAARAILTGEIDTLPSATITVPLPSRLRKTSSVRAVEGALDLQWHTDQLHAMAADRDPDLGRSIARTLITTIKRNGIDALVSKRGTPSAPTDSTGGPVVSTVRTVGRRIAGALR